MERSSTTQVPDDQEHTTGQLVTMLSEQVSVLIRDQAIWSLISGRLIVGERIGTVPDNVPMIPLQSDLVDGIAGDHVDAVMAVRLVRRLHRCVDCRGRPACKPLE